MERHKDIFFFTTKNIMPTKYSDRLNIPTAGMSDIVFSTKNGLKIATGYKRVIIEKKPMVEFLDSHMEKTNIHVPQNQQWKLKNPQIIFAEYASKDYCNVKILRSKKNGRYYISPFDLISDKIPVLISPLQRRKTILATA